MRIPPDMPPGLKAGLDRLVHGVSRNMIAERAAAQSRNYRAGGGSQAIATANDALAYASARMPATYAAAIAVFDAVRDVFPAFQPRTLLDVGAGPGTATFAAIQAFDRITGIRLVDANASLRALALILMADADNEGLRQVAHLQSYRQGDALAMLAGAEPADLVITSYAAGEIANGELARFTQLLWGVASGVLVIIEPGTPAGYRRILRMRDELIAAG